VILNDNYCTHSIEIKVLRSSGIGIVMISYCSMLLVLSCNSKPYEEDMRICLLLPAKGLPLSVSS
jgi:hypothetical protein